MLYFHSPNEFPIEAVSMQGLSVKVTDSPIGQFGTGLKYAIAVILRHGGSIELFSEGNSYKFRSGEKSFRGQAYEAIFMDGPEGTVQLPFTLNYGKNWEAWQAYRELYSNCLDEGGDVSTSPVVARTFFAVEGLEEAHSKHDFIFFKGNPKGLIYSSPLLEIYDQPSLSLFYRGIRVADHPSPCKLTYNIKTSITLTEDRTIKDRYMMLYAVANEVVSGMGEVALTRFFKDCPDIFSNWSNYISQTPSPALINVVRQGKGSMEAIAYVSKHRPLRDALEEIVLTPHQLREVKKACALVAQLVPGFSISELKFCANLKNAAGAYLPKTDEIWISSICFEEGFDYLVSTIYEEALHKHRQVYDCTRELQNILFKKVVQLAREVYE